MRLAILFWFYKDIHICENRLRLMRKYNPDVPIYGFYGGDPSDSKLYSSSLSRYLDDFYEFEEQRDASWKWQNGDLMLADWFKYRGKSLSWDTIVVVQWDMLVIGPIYKIFSMLKKDEILISGLRPVSEVQQWGWVAEDQPERRERYLEFLQYLKLKYNFKQDPLCCLFLVACLPRKFMEKYSQIENRELGFFEYRIPIYAQVFDTPLCMQHPFTPWWDRVEPMRWDSILRAVGIPISEYTIYKNLLLRRGARIFHPYHDVFPVAKFLWLRALRFVLITKFKRIFNRIPVQEELVGANLDHPVTH